MEDGRYIRYLQYDQKVIEVLIRRSRRKTLAIHVFPDRPVELRVPMKCPWPDIESFLESRRGWIIESVTSLAGDRVPVSPKFVGGEEHFFMGRPLRLQLSEGRTRRVSIVNDTMVVRCPFPENAGEVRRAIEAFYRAEAVRLLPGRLAACRDLFRDALPDSILSIRKMKSKWGSCSNRGEICLNSLLIQKPMEAIDFVVTHELCHLRHFAHDKSFYRLMDRTMPDWREREKLLTRNDAGVVQLGLF